jgi:hypothetical protein
VELVEAHRGRIRRSVARRRMGGQWLDEMPSCLLCGFFLTQVHHRYGVLAGDGPDNLVDLCPNHHSMVHRGLLSLVPLREAADDAGEAGVDG